MEKSMDSPKETSRMIPIQYSDSRKAIKMAIPRDSDSDFPKVRCSD